MFKKIDKDFLSDIEEAMRRTNSYTENLSYEEFLEYIKTQDAVIRNIAIIGEAAKNISEELRSKYQEIQLKDMAGLSDKLIHYYFSVNLDIVWTAVREEFPVIVL
ncbi:MAG: DUF86 domain-containing protein [Thermodesulfobacteriota bacterium]|nr:DUF86 domain-containing protein [Thermodesulfobacteriota bacterium]